jgi:hypothetical protein
MISADDLNPYQSNGDICKWTNPYQANEDICKWVELNYTKRIVITSAMNYAYANQMMISAEQNQADAIWRWP